MLDMERLQADAEQGILPALTLLGAVYLKGDEENDIEPDLSKAITYYQRAAQGGHPMAMHQIADMYRGGIGVAPDEEKAKYWEERAREQEARDKEQEDAKKPPVRLAFEQNLKFISRGVLDVELVQYVFGDTQDLRQYTLGECAFPSGRLLTADPLCYLQSPRDVHLKERSIKPGVYMVQVAIMDSGMAGRRIVGARLKISEQEAVSYELAKCRKEAVSHEPAEGDKEDGMAMRAGFMVECGMACFCDEQVAWSYWKFLDYWYRKHEGGNIYDDYFEALFAQSYQENPEVQRECGDLLMWSNPLDGSKIPMFASGMGDGYYTDYWGVDAAGELCELVIIFMNPYLFKD